MLKYNIYILLILLTVGMIQLVKCQQNSCPIVTAPDGSTYDLSYISNRVYQYVQYAGSGTYTYNISICEPIPSGCAGSCISPNSAGVCQFWGPQAPATAKCMGQFNTGQLIGLNNGLGVQIKYGGGDVCGSCNPAGSRTSIITLLCSDNGSDLSNITWTSFVSAEPTMPPFLYFNGTFNCVPSSPSSYNPYKHVTTQYFGFGSRCDGSDAYLVTVNRTRSCTPGCQKLFNTYVLTYCDETVRLPSDTWIEQINYEVNKNNTCDTPQSATYTRSKQCAGSFDFSYQQCDANAVYTLSCDSPFCNQCTLSSKTPTNVCSNGTMLRCAHG